jgi:hypothetical protein
MVSLGPKEMFGAGLTKTIRLASEKQLLLYWILYFIILGPTNWVVGQKTVPDVSTPAPDHFPPDGYWPVRTKQESLAQTSSPGPERATGAYMMVNSSESLVLHLSFS